MDDQTQKMKLIGQRKTNDGVHFMGYRREDA
jgi:hypothetical protein